MAKRKCVVCGKEFNLSPSHEARGKALGQAVGTYCSRKCQHNGKMVLCRCKQCFGVYEVNLAKTLSGNYGCCSDRCSMLYQQERKGWMPVVACAFCGKEFQRSSNHVNKDGDNYCSLECSTEASRKYFPKLCEHCGKEFVPDYEDKRFCSKRCGERGRRAKAILQRCSYCHKRFWSKDYAKRKFCSSKCAYRFNSGDRHHRWEGGKSHSGGYRTLRSKKHGRAQKNGYVFIHILVMEAYLGRPLEYYGPGHPDNEIVHHVDRDKRNYKLWNLELCLSRVHAGYHASHVLKREAVKGVKYV